MPTLDYEIAGLRLRIETESPYVHDQIAARFASYEASPDERPPDAIIEFIDRGSVWRTALPYAAPFPQAEVRDRNGVFEVWRKEFEGEIAPGDPVRARFQIAAALLSFETPVRLVTALCGSTRGSLLLHASGALFDGRALVFTAKSGGGKTTLLALLADQIPLSDEVVALLTRRDAPLALATPFTGGPRPARNASGPLAGMCFLGKGPTNRIEPAVRRTALPRLMRNTLAFIADPATADGLLSSVDALCRSTPMFELQFEKSSDISKYLRDFVGVASSARSLVSDGHA